MDRRLQIVAELIQADAHADIGSDHAGLLVDLLERGRIQYGIAIENKTQPFENSRRKLAGYAADVRLADGLSGLENDEVESLSICGMGAESIVRILEAWPDRVPARVVLQPNRCSEVVRVWARRAGFQLTFEAIVYERWDNHILAFRGGAGESDPAYEGLDVEAALLLGPLNIRGWRPEFVEYLWQQQTYLRQLPRRTRQADHRLRAIERLLSNSDHSAG